MIADLLIAIVAGLICVGCGVYLYFDVRKDAK